MQEQTTLPAFVEVSPEMVNVALGALPAAVPSGSAADGGPGYQRATIHRSEQMELAAARWRAGGESALHGHGDSAAVYAVLSGVIEEERYVPDGKGGYRYEVAVLRAGERN